MGRVEALTEPLRSADECERVRGEGVGRDNVDKLKEIVCTGAFRRTAQLALDPHHQCIKLVQCMPLQSSLSAFRRRHTALVCAGASMIANLGLMLGVSAC